MCFYIHFYSAETVKNGGTQGGIKAPPIWRCPQMKLTDIKCKSAEIRDKAYKLSDGAGMYLEVMPSGSKYWRLKYRYNGKDDSFF